MQIDLFNVFVFLFVVYVGKSFTKAICALGLEINFGVWKHAHKINKTQRKIKKTQKKKITHKKNERYACYFPDSFLKEFAEFDVIFEIDRLQYDEFNQQKTDEVIKNVLDENRRFEDKISILRDLQHRTEICFQPNDILSYVIEHIQNSL